MNVAVIYRQHGFHLYPFSAPIHLGCTQILMWGVERCGRGGSQEPWVLVWVTVAKMKHRDQKRLGRKGFIQLTLPYHCSSLEESGLELTQGQEPGGRS